jgi:integrase
MIGDAYGLLLAYSLPDASLIFVENTTMPRTKLNEASIGRATRESVERNVRIGLTDLDQKGLMLRITPNGIRTWVLSCRDYHSRYRMFSLGSYPAIGLAAARIAARSLREDVRRGADPTADKRARRQAVREAKVVVASGPEHTIRTLLDEYERLKVNGRKSWKRARMRLSFLLQEVIDVGFDRLTYADLRRVFEGHPSQISAKWGCQQMKPIFRWAIETQRDYVPADFVNLNFGIKSEARKRVLSADELKVVLLALDAHRDDVWFAAMRFILLTLLRVNEVSGLRWKDVDLEAKTITLPVTKNGEPHVVPLSRQALQIIAERKPAKVRLDGSVFAGITTNWNPAQRRINRLSGTDGWHRHDLRRTGATLLGEMGIVPDIVEAALNHVSIHNQLAATYNRSRYRPQVAEALQRLADKLDDLVGERP